MKEMKKKKVKNKVEWKLDGHSGESAEVKAAKKAERERSSIRLSKYTRGLRICPDGRQRNVIVDRDVCGCEGIGVIWVANNVEGFELPEPYKPKKRKKPEVHVQQ